MLFAVKMISDVPYGPYNQKLVNIDADNLYGLYTEAIPDKAFLEFTKFQTAGWPHVNLKFCCENLKIEFVFDMVQARIVTVYITDECTDETLACSRSPLTFADKNNLRREVMRLAGFCKCLIDSGGLAGD